MLEIFVTGMAYGVVAGLGIIVAVIVVAAALVIFSYLVGRL